MDVKFITLCIPEKIDELLEELVKMGHYPNKSEAIRTAIRDLVVSEHPAFKKQKALETVKPCRK